MSSSINPMPIFSNGSKSSQFTPRLIPDDLNDLDSYVYSYLTKRKYATSAQTFAKEVGDRVRTAPLEEWQSANSLLSE
jgi:hypothetical protein